MDIRLTCNNTITSIHIDNWEILFIRTPCKKMYLGGEHRVDWITTYPSRDLFKDFQHIPSHLATKGNVIIGKEITGN